MTNNGKMPHEDEQPLVNPPTSSIFKAPPSPPSSPSHTTTFPAPMSPTSARSTDEVALPLHRRPSPDGLTKAEYHRLQQVTKKRETRREKRAKMQLAAGTSLKAACLKHRTGGATFAAEFSLRPNNVHVTSTGVIGRALGVHREVTKGTSLKTAKKFGFGYVKWTGKYA